MTVPTEKWRRNRHDIKTVQCPLRNEATGNEPELKDPETQEHGIDVDTQEHGIDVDHHVEQGTAASPSSSEYRTRSGRMVRPSGVAWV